MPEHSADQTTWYLSPLTLHTAAVSTVRSLLVASRHGQATIYLFQKCLLCWEWEYIVCHNGIASVKVKCSVLLVFLLLKTKLLQRNCRVLRVTKRCFWNEEKMFRAVYAVFPRWPACLFNPALEGIELSYADITYFCDRALVHSECLE